jgi:ribonucleoside-diphosphate reductase alpha chain
MSEVFINKGGSGGCNSNLNALSRMISIALRAGVDVKDVADQLGSTINCPSFASSRAKGISLSPGSSCAGAVGKALIELNKEFQKMWRFMIIAENEEEVEEQKIMGLKECPECKERTLQMAGGCMQCSNCGYSKCD